MDTKPCTWPSRQWQFGPGPQIPASPSDPGNEGIVKATTWQFHRDIKNQSEIDVVFFLGHQQLIKNWGLTDVSWEFDGGCVNINWFSL